MQKIAVIEDDRPTSNMLRRWIETAVPGARVDQWFTREDAEAAILNNAYDLLSLDIELGPERNAGVSLIKAATRDRPVPVLVVSGMPADVYRGVMRALDAWDYLQKPVLEHEFTQTLLEILRLAARQRVQSQNSLIMDPLHQAKPTWKGQRLNLSSGQQRLLNAIYKKRLERDPTATYDELYGVVLSGKNQQNVRKQISQIKAAFLEIDTAFQSIVVEPMRGYRWIDR